MRRNKNFGLSRQEPTKETYDNFKLGKNWDLGFISKEGMDLRREQKKAETDSLRTRTDVMQHIMTTPTQNQEEAMSMGTVAMISALVIVIGVGFAVMAKRKSNKIIPENTLVVDQIV